MFIDDFHLLFETLHSFFSLFKGCLLLFIFVKKITSDLMINDIIPY